MFTLAFVAEIDGRSFLMVYKVGKVFWLHCVFQQWCFIIQCFLAASVWCMWSYEH